MTELVYDREVTVAKDGAVTIEGLPVHEGERVKVLVYRVGQQEVVDPSSLQGLPYRYEDPFEPAVPPEEWDAVRGVLFRDSD